MAGQSAMNATAQAQGRRLWGTDPLVLVAVAALGFVTLVLVFLADGNLGVAVAPLALVVVGGLMARAPLRHSLLVLGFLALTLENPGEVFASDKWHSPIEILGALLLGHLNITIPVSALFFSGADVVLLFLTAIWIVRRIAGSAVDTRASVPFAEPMRVAALVSFATIFLIWGFGLSRAGADLGKSLWQVKQVIYLPGIFLLYCIGLRGPDDSRPLGIALLVAALLHAVVAGYVRFLFPDTLTVPHATTHSDSMLFADAFLLVLVMFFERPNARNLMLMGSALPILTWGMIANNRRLAWVELGVGLVLLFFITPFTRLKRRIAQALAIATPVFLIYLVVGWNASSSVFGAAHMIRSVVDSKSDPSTRWRDFENYDLAYTIRGNPVLGTGFGHPYEEIIHLPDISHEYELYRHVPHNSVLSAFTYTGIVGFIGIWSIIPLGVFFAVRSYRFASNPRDRTAALTTVGILVSYLLHCYGDMGLGTWTSLFTVAPALALVAKLSVATGGWPLRRRGLAAPVPRPPTADPRE